MSARVTSVSPPAPDETSRLAALQALALLDTAPQAEFDAIARLAAAATGCTTAAVGLIDAHRMWIKASAGEAPAELPRREAFCDAVIRSDAPVMVADARNDPRFCNLRLVRDGIRFYAGEPLRVTDEAGAQQTVGTLCVIDTAVRTLSDGQAAAFRDLARVAEALMAARQVAREALVHATAIERQQRLFRQAERMAGIGWWRLDLEDDRLEWSDGIFRIHEIEPGRSPSLSEGLDFYPPQARAMVSRALAHTIETGQPFDFEADFISAKAAPRRVRSMGEVEWTDGRPSAVIGVFRDITEEHALSLALRESAETDPLTMMPNRGAFTRRLDRAVAASRVDGAPFALLLVDLDGFKRINDTFGHLAGDEVLKAVATRLRAPWLHGSCAARLGGDEFAVIVDDARLLADDAELVASLESELQLRTRFDGIVLESGASVGLMRFDPAMFDTQRAFIHAADAELYAAKRRRVGERRAA